MTKFKTYAIITVIYKNLEYESLPLDLDEDSPINDIVMTLSEEGTSKLQMLKLPMDENSFMIFSKEQLIESLIKVSIFDVPEPKSVRSRIK